MFISINLFTNCNKNIDTENFPIKNDETIGSTDNISMDSISLQLNLNTLELSSNFFELRFWNKFLIKRCGQLLIFKIDNKNNFYCYNYLYWDSKKVNSYTPKVDTFTVIRKNPKSGWKNLISLLLKQKILELPNYNSIKGWKNKDISDGVDYFVEYKYKGYYHKYYYFCPELYKNYWNSKQMLMIISILKKELDYDDNTPLIYFSKLKNL